MTIWGFSVEQWEHLKKMHCIFPKMGNSQAYFICWAHCTHYQDLFLDFKKAFNGYDGNIEVNIYNLFLVLLSQDTTTSPFLSRMNWMVVLVLIESSGKKVGSNSPSYIE
jgi:hypothetical protein